jgi:hypothetical protein
MITDHFIKELPAPFFAVRSKARGEFRSTIGALVQAGVVPNSARHFFAALFWQ